MNARRLLLLTAALAGLLGAGLWLSKRERAEAPTLGEERARIVPNAPALDELTAVELTVGAAGSPQLRFKRDPQRGWLVTGAYSVPADPERLRRFVEAVSKLSGEERARGRKWFPDFGLDEEKALTITLRSEGRAAISLAAGRSPKNMALEFVRRKEGETIYSVDEGFLGQLGLWGKITPEALSLRDWADLRLFPVEPADVRGVQTAERAKKKEAWDVRAAREDVSDPKVKDWLDRLVTLRAADPLAPQAQTNFPPAWRWTLQRQAGPPLQLEEAAPADKSETATVRLSPEGPYFSAPATVLKQYREELTAIPPPPPAPAPAAAPESSASPSTEDSGASRAGGSMGSMEGAPRGRRMASASPASPNSRIVRYVASSSHQRRPWAADAG